MARQAAADPTSLEGQHCVPCGTGDRLGVSERRELLEEVPQWRMEGESIVREFEFKDFSGALRFLNAVAKIAEQEDHHPDLHLTDYKELRIELTTHAAQGLSRNDFILASKIDALTKRSRRPSRRRQREAKATG